MSAQLARLGAAVVHSLRQQWRHRATALMLMIGLAAPTAVAVSVPLYSNAASDRLFEQQLGNDAAGPVELAFLFSYNRLSGGSRDWSEVVPLDDEFLGDPPPENLPLAAAERSIETEPFALLTGADPDSDERIGTVTLGSATNFDAAAEFVDGRPPEPSLMASGLPDEPLEVAVGAVFADQESLSVGQELVLFDSTAESDAPLRRISVVIVGIWVDRGEPGTLVGEDAYRRRLVVPEPAITEVISPQRADLIQNIRWELTLDRTDLTVDNAGTIVRASDRMVARAESLLPGTRQVSNPSGALRTFQSQEQALRRGLRNFSLPLLALSGAVGALMISLTLRSRAHEFAMLRRRGVPRWSLLASETTAALIVTVGAAVPGVVAGHVIASIIGRTRTFFRLGADAGSSFGLSMSSEAWRSVVFAAAIICAAQVTAAVVATRRSVCLDEGRHPTGQPERPWWQRTYVDVFAVLLIAVVAWRGVRDDSGRAALLDDPAVILLPAITALAVGLLLLRIVPVMMAGAAALLERTDNVASLLAARRAARVSGDVAAPLMLLVITASLATFTASLAVTLDLQLLDTAHHRIGGVAVMVDDGVPAPDVDRNASARRNAEDVPPLARSGTGHAALGDYARVWGVERASATIDVNGSATYEGGEVNGLQFLGVDPTTFASVSFWRSDYGDTLLAELMRRLNSVPNGVLLSSEISSSIRPGDSLRFELRNESGTASFTGVAVGRFDQFPGWFPDVDPALVVGNAQLVEDVAGTTFDRRVIFEAGPAFGNGTRVGADLAAIGVSPTARTTAVVDVIDRAQTVPGRQGVLGMLTVGVGLATVLTLAGFVITTSLAVRRRSTEVGVLRAMGMKRREIATLALFDLATVMMVGLAAAIALGLAMSRWFIPVLVDTPPGAAPVLLPAVAWGAAGAITALLVALLAASGVIVAVMMRRVRVFESIRLGES